MNGADNRRIGAEGFAPAAQNNGVAGLQREDGRVGGDVRPTFVDDGDDTEGDGGLLDHEPVWTLHTAEHLALWIGQRGDFADALGHAGDALRRQGEPVKHDLAVPVA